MKEANTHEYSFLDFVKVTSPNLSSFGPNVLSNKPSQPLYSFSKTTRQKETKRYQCKEISQIECFGRQTPMGPLYDQSLQFKFATEPNFSFSQAPRVTQQTNCYQYYLHKQDNTQLNQADRSRRAKPAEQRFDLQPRFKQRSKLHKDNPGPIYNPTFSNVKKGPAFSLYSRRSVKGQDFLVQQGSTPVIIGPNSYYPQKSCVTSNKHNTTATSFPRRQRFQNNSRGPVLNQTFNCQSSIGQQANSRMKSAPKFSIGKDRRNNKSGVMHSHMQYRPQSVRIQHPRT